MPDASSAAKRRAAAQLRQVILLQSQWRRKLALRELRGLRTEAKSASKFKEISYQLENKVVELTQTLQKRTADNKELGSNVRSLEQQLIAWQGKHEEASSRAKTLEAELAKPTVPVSRFEAVMAAQAETDRKLHEAARRMTDQEKEVTRLTQELQLAAQDLEERQLTVDSAVTRGTEDASTIAGLRLELASLKEQISRSNALNALTKNQREPPLSPTANGLRTFEHGGADSRTPSMSRRRVRRHSAIEPGPQQHSRKSSTDEIMAMKKGHITPRAVSVMYPQNGPPRPRDSNGLPTVNDSSSDEIMRLLEDEEGLEDDVLKGLIDDLKIPAASLHNPPLAKEVIFPAHLISLVSNEMWKLGMIPESERFLANVMQAIQNHVMVSTPYTRPELIVRPSKVKMRLYRVSSGYPMSRRSSPSSAWPSLTRNEASHRATMKKAVASSIGKHTSDWSRLSSMTWIPSSTTFTTLGCWRSRSVSTRW